MFGILRVAVEEAEEQLGPFDYHDTAHLLQHNPDKIFLKPGDEFGTCQRNEASPSKENYVDTYSQGEGKGWSNKS